MQRGKGYSNQIGYYGGWSEMYHNVQLKNYLKKMCDIFVALDAKKILGIRDTKSGNKVCVTKIATKLQCKKEKRKNPNSDTIEFSLWIINYLYELFHFFFLQI